MSRPFELERILSQPKPLESETASAAPDTPGASPATAALSSSKQVDVVFIHGLLGGAFVTWRTTEHNGKDNVIWPSAWLVEDIPDLRLLSISYQSALLDDGLGDCCCCCC